jgi:hypothetical protein
MSVISCPSDQLVTAKESGVPLSTLHLWHKRGWLQKDVDFFEEWLSNYHKQPARRYVPAALERCRAQGKSDRAAKRKSHLAATEKTCRRGEWFVRGSHVRRVLGISKLMLADWNLRGWPLLDGDHARICKEGGATYYALAQVEEVKFKLDGLPSCIPAEHATLYSLQQAAELTGLQESCLLGKTRRKVMGLKAVPFLVRLAFANRQGKPRKLLKNVLGFTRESVDAYCDRQRACAVPQGATTLQKLVLKLRKTSERCRITAATVNGWCHAGLIDAKLMDYPTVRGLRNGWIIANGSVDEVKRVLRQVGWDAKAATAELQALSDRRVTENGGKPLPSLLVTVGMPPQPAAPELPKNATSGESLVLGENAAAAISDRQRDILQVLTQSKAFNIDYRMTTEEIVKLVEGQGHGSAVSFKRPIADLRQCGLIETKAGPGGGCWLTAAGQTLIAEIRPPGSV